MTGGAIHRRAWPGDADRPALALHCMMGSGRYWGDIAAHLDGRIDLAGFDMPGHGRSGDWAPGPDDPDFHTAVTRIAASFINRPLDLIGHSFGATVALRLAIAAPEAVRSLTLIEPVLFAALPTPSEQDMEDRLDGLLAEGRNADAAREFLTVWGDTPYDDLPPAAQDQMRKQIALVALGNQTLIRDGANLLRPDGLEAVDAPVLLISGEKSPQVIHDIAEALAARLPDVGRATVPGAGHMLPITHPEQVAGLIGVNLDRA